MIEIPTQVRDRCPVCNSSFGCFYLPFGEEAEEKTKEFKLHQIVRSVMYGVKKPRSVKQLKRFWGICGVISENSTDVNFNSKEKVAEQVKIALQFINANLIVVKPDGTVHIPYRSISFKELPHMEACNFFKRADDVFWSILTRMGMDPKSVLGGDDD